MLPQKTDFSDELQQWFDRVQGASLFQGEALELSSTADRDDDHAGRSFVIQHPASV
jgi:hypothetical protein